MTMNAKELREALANAPGNATVVYDPLGRSETVAMVTVTQYEHPGARQIVTLYGDIRDPLPINEIEL